MTETINFLLVACGLVVMAVTGAALVLVLMGLAFITIEKWIQK